MTFVQTNNMAGILSELPTSTVRLIGSGQVITSVFSVVKELFENAVDASSSIIDIKLDDYGLERIEVCDNGKGVKGSDVSYMTKRHYTSKLSQMDDLLSLKTYGFRGEALASLCAVSDVTIVTKTNDDEISSAYTFDAAGNVTSSKPSHLGTGTTVTARNLFKNLPVRKQCYKTSQKKKEDLRKIEELLMVFAIIKPNLRITLKNGSEVVFQKLPMPDTKGVLHAVLGRHISNQLVYREQSFCEQQGSVLAFLPKPGSDIKTMSRSSGDRTFVVVNDRPVYVKELTRLLKRYYVNCHACDSVRFPVCYISVKLPISDVDVNVDPNKSTVFLRPVGEVCNCLEEILLQVYGPLDNVPSWHYSEASENKIGTQSSTKICAKFSTMDAENNNSKLPKTANDVIKIRDERDFDCSRISVITNESSINLEASEDQNQTGNEITGSKNDEVAGKDSQLPLHMISENLSPPSNRHCDTSAESGPIFHTSLEAGECFNKDEETVKSPESAVTRNVDFVLEHHEVEPKETSSSHASDWSKGSTLADTSGQTIQPVLLLAPTSKHTPGKRPLSPANEEFEVPPLKRKSSSSTACHLPSDQPTLPFMVNSPTVQASSSVGSSHNVDNTSQSGGGKEFRQQERKEPLAFKSKKLSKNGLLDQIAAQTSQSQTDKTKKTLRLRLYHAEKKVLCAVEALRKATVDKETSEDRLYFPKPVIVGHADSCDAWLCCLGSKLGVLNIHRLAESILYKRLRAKHILPFAPLEQLVPLDLRNLSELQVSELEKLSQECQARGTFEITDNRLVANGFDVKCSSDSSGTFSSQLFGICNLVPTYNVEDLCEILDKLAKEPSSDLASVRPTKVLYYLQGEAARMAQQNSNSKTMQEVQGMLDQMESDIVKGEKCIHLKPLFSELLSLNELCLHNNSDDEEEI